MILKRGINRYVFTNLGEKWKALNKDDDSEDGIKRKIRQNFPVDMAFCSHWTWDVDDGGVSSWILTALLARTNIFCGSPDLSLEKPLNFKIYHSMADSCQDLIGNEGGPVQFRGFN